MGGFSRTDTDNSRWVRAHAQTTEPRSLGRFYLLCFFFASHTPRAVITTLRHGNEDGLIFINASYRFVAYGLFRRFFGNPTNRPGGGAAGLEERIIA